jgi:hypothetical protein
MTSRFFLITWLLAGTVVSTAFGVDSGIHSGSSAATPPVPGDARFSAGLVTFPTRTPLALIPIYQLEVTAANADFAVKALNTEIERLYTHAKTLDSGAVRRAFESRIYFFDKRLRPLANSFDPAVWESLRADVRAEWVSILSSLAPTVAASPVSG